MPPRCAGLVPAVAVPACAELEALGDFAQAEPEPDGSFLLPK